MRERVMGEFAQLRIVSNESDQRCTRGLRTNSSIATSGLGQLDLPRQHRTGATTSLDGYASKERAAWHTMNKTMELP